MTIERITTAEVADDERALESTVRPRRTVNGWMTASGSISTVGSIHVVGGSTIVTPASINAHIGTNTVLPSEPEVG